jgi:ketosteroid isomerase-like protein
MARTVRLGVACLLTVWFAGAPRGQTPQVALSTSEQAAIEVVRGWVGGWEAKNAELVGSFMDEDVFWAGGFPNDPMNGIWRGRDRFVQQDGGAVRGGVKFRVLDELAVGGSAGTAVLHRRIDESGFGPYMALGGRGGGPGVWFVNAVFYWVVDGRIRVWLDGPTSFPPVPRDQAPPIDSWRADEQAALALVDQWVAAWNARDADRVASSMIEGVEFNTNFPQQVAEIGRDHFLRTRRRTITAGVQMRVGESLAVGGTRGAAVLIRRTDRVTVQGRQRETANAAFFWVENGRIRLWYDVPLDAQPRAAARPAAGVAQAPTQDARALVDQAQQAMGIRGLTSLGLTANGTLADTAEAWGGNAPQPIVQRYEAAFDFATPAMRLRIVRTNPDGTPLKHGTEERQFLSGNTAWDQPPASPRGGGAPGAPGFEPGPAGAPGGAPPGPGAPAGPPANAGGAGGRRGSGPPGAGRGGPVIRTASAVPARRMQILLTPPGFLAAARQYSATAGTQGGGRTMTFTTPEGQRYEGRLDRSGLLTRIATTNPANTTPVSVTLSMYRTFNGVRYPSRIVQTEGAVEVLNLTVTDVRPGVAPDITVPPQAVR